MKQTITLLKKGFESSERLTPEFQKFFTTFKKEFIKIIKPYVSKIELSRCHFYISGFFQTKGGQIYYINTSDVRWFGGNGYIRTAESFRDYTGGTNISFRLDDTFEPFIKKVLKVA